jgi:hypothetical protein
MASSHALFDLPAGKPYSNVILAIPNSWRVSKRQIKVGVSDMTATIALPPHAATSSQHKHKHFNTPKAQEEITAVLSEHDEAKGVILPPFDYGQIANEDARAIAKQAFHRHRQRVAQSESRHEARCMGELAHR